MNNRTPFLLCLIGGILLIITSVAGSIGFFADLIAYAAASFPDLAGILEWILVILSYIAGLGGIGVILGGFLLTRNRVGTGKFIIGIAAGIGLIGLIINLIQIFLVGGALGTFNILALGLQSPGWVGAFITIPARRMASTE